MRFQRKVRSIHILFKERGFTLVEMIVAMFIFGVLATGMTTLMGVLIQNNEFAQDITVATTWAENKMEEFENIPFESITSGWNWDLPIAGFWRVWEVRDNIPQAGLKQITVMVIWFDSKYQFHTVSLLTLKST
ncbi:MAG: prepilin-type N-terminal cleavage/methylation domain-containing protein [Gemmatimonadota bacterium]|nr:MAG: prepilin-type N-terminal cleavage/methylation domain-containing protein [Gemmatimonadota bacterium]